MKKDSEQSNLAGRNDLIDDQDEPFNLQSEKYLRSLLAPLEKGQLVDLLVDMGMQNPEVAEGIRAVAGSDPPNRILFVHGLSLGTTSESLCDAFSAHGEIEEGSVIVDKATGRSRGFGFITFKKVESVQEALQERPTRVIDGSRASCRLHTTEKALRRLYVTGLSPHVSPRMFRSFFEKYGEVKEVSVVYDRETNISTGIGFVTYKTDRAARRAINNPDKFLWGRKITVKKAWAQPKGKEEETHEEPVTYPPRTFNSPEAVAQQDYLLQSQVPQPHVSRNEPYGMPSAYATGISGYPVPHPAHVSVNMPYGIPSAYPTAISGYFVPHPAYRTGISGYPVPHPHASGIPSTYPTRISGYPVPHLHVSENEPN